MNKANKNRLISMLWLSLCLLLPSLRFIQKYLGNLGIIIVAVGVFMSVYFGAIFSQRIHRAKFLPLVYLITFVIVIAIFIWVYPIANSGAYGGIGSDRDDAINIGVMRLVGGQYPYYAKTYLGNPLSPLPGAFLLGSPFVLLLGNSAYQNLFWLPVFFLLSRSILRNEPANIFLMIVSLVACPMIMHEVVHGGDLLSNSIYCLVAVCLFKFAFDNQASAWKKLLSAVFLGVSLASRFNFIFLLPLIFLSVIKSRLKDALLFTGVIILTFLLLTLPFYLYDSSSFSPLYLTKSHISSRILASFPGWLIPLFTLIISCLIGFRYPVQKFSTLLWSCSIVQMLPIVAVTLLQSLKSNKLDFGSDGFGSTGYGLVFVFFGLLSMGIRIFSNKGIMADSNSAR